MASAPTNPNKAQGNSQLVEWKTNAWKDPGMVAWYANQMTATAGTNRLKNLLEVELIRRYAQGKSLIDVGIGTGRGSLPLLEAGFHITGIDSSQAMLDETRRQAGEKPIELKLGDVARLPVPDETFDTLISLNVMVHFPHWQEVLSEWRRVVRLGGRIVFDIHSLDHPQAVFPDPAVCESRLTASSEKGQDKAAYMSRVKARQMVEAADAQDLAIVDIVPYGAFLAGGNTNFLLAEPLESKHWWNRLLGWMSSDDKLLAFGQFLEEEVVSRLTTAFTGRMMVVLEKRRDPESNNRWLGDFETRTRELRQAGSSGLLPDWLPLNDPSFLETLTHHLYLPRNRQLLYHVLKVLRSRWPALSWEALVPAPFSQLFDDWNLQDDIDSVSTDLIRNWPSASSVGSSLAWRGTPLAPALEYVLMENLLTQVFGVFSGNRK